MHSKDLSQEQKDREAKKLADNAKHWDELRKKYVFTDDSFIGIKPSDDKSPIADILQIAGVLQKASASMSHFTYVSPKGSGANDKEKELSGFYKIEIRKDKPLPADEKVAAPPVDEKKVDYQEVLFKQNSNAKKIAEFVAAGIKNALIGNKAAPVFYAKKPRINPLYPNKPKEENIDLGEEGDDVFVGSVKYKGIPLYRDVFQYQGIEPPESRPQRIESDKDLRRTFKQSLLKKNAEGRLVSRYKNAEGIIIANVMTGDFDLHSENIFVLKDADGNPTDELVNIDHDAALKNLPPIFDIHQARALKVIRRDPTNHFEEIIYLTVSKKFAEEADRLSSDEAIENLNAAIKASLEKTSHFFGSKAIHEFAKRIGLSGLPLIYISPKTELEEENLKADLITKIENFLADRYKTMQRSLQTYSLETKICLCLKEKPNHQWEFVDTDYDIEELILNNPEYFREGKFKFYGDHMGWRDLKEHQRDALTKLLLEKTNSILTPEPTLLETRTISNISVQQSIEQLLTEHHKKSSFGAGKSASVMESRLTKTSNKVDLYSVTLREKKPAAVKEEKKAEAAILIEEKKPEPVAEPPIENEIIWTITDNQTDLHVIPDSVVPEKFFAKLLSQDAELQVQINEIKDNALKEKLTDIEGIFTARMESLRNPPPREITYESVRGDIFAYISNLPAPGVTTKKANDLAKQLFNEYQSRMTMQWQGKKIPHKTLIMTAVYQIESYFKDHQPPIYLNSAWDKQYVDAFVLYCNAREQRLGEKYKAEAINRSGYQCNISPEIQNAFNDLLENDKDLTNLINYYHPDVKAARERVDDRAQLLDGIRALLSPEIKLGKDEDIHLPKNNRYTTVLTSNTASVQEIITVFKALKVDDPEKTANDFFAKKQIAILTRDLAKEFNDRYGIDLTLRIENTKAALTERLIKVGDGDLIRQKIDILKNKQYPTQLEVADALWHLGIIKDNSPTDPLASRIWKTKHRLSTSLTALGVAIEILGNKLLTKATEYKEKGNPIRSNITLVLGGLLKLTGIITWGVFWLPLHGLKKLVGYDSKFEDKTLVRLTPEVIRQYKVANSAEGLDLRGITSLPYIKKYDSNDKHRPPDSPLTMSMFVENLANMPSVQGKLFQFPKGYTDIVAYAMKGNSWKVLFQTMPSIRGPADLYAAPFMFLTIITSWITTLAQLALQSVGALLTSPYRRFIHPGYKKLGDHTGLEAKKWKAANILGAILYSPILLVAQAFHFAGRVLSYTRFVVDSFCNAPIKLIANITNAVSYGDKIPYPSFTTCAKSFFGNLAKLGVAALAVVAAFVLPGAPAIAAAAVAAKTAVTAFFIKASIFCGFAAVAGLISQAMIGSAKHFAVAPTTPPKAPAKKHKTPVASPVASPAALSPAERRRQKAMSPEPASSPGRSANKDASGDPRAPLLQPEVKHKRGSSSGTIHEAIAAAQAVAVSPPGDSSVQPPAAAAAPANHSRSHSLLFAAANNNDAGAISTLIAAIRSDLQNTKGALNEEGVASLERIKTKLGTLKEKADGKQQGDIDVLLQEVDQKLRAPAVVANNKP